MPANWGLYLYGAEEGTEVSSTYEGRHITCTAAELITDDGSGTATKGHACVFGLIGLQAVGVCFNSGTGSDLIAIDTEGIWNLPVYGKDDGGNRVLSPGEPVFIDVADCEISGERNNATQIPFGYLLTEVASGAETISVVKVHWDPRAHWLQDDEMLYFGDARDVSIEWNQTALEMLPVGDNIDFLIGDGTNSFDVQIFGNTAAYSMLWDSALNTLDITSLIAVADDVLHVTVTDTSSHAGQSNAIHVNMNKTAGAITNTFAGIASDLSVEANVTHAYAITVYTQIAGTPTIGDYSAFRCYMNDLGAACAPTVQAYQCMDLNIDCTNVASGSAQGNSFFRLYTHGAVANQIFVIPGGFGATYLYNWTAVIPPCEAFVGVGNGVISIAIRHGGVTSWLHTYDQA